MDSSSISARGYGFLPRKPIFFDVLQNQWSEHENPNGIVNLGLAENSLMHEEMTKYINEHLRITNHALTYGDGFSGSLYMKKAMSHFLNRHFAPYTTVMPTDVIITSGASNAIECCAWSFCEQGDFVVVGCPFWTTFRSIFAVRAGVRLLEVHFDDMDPLGEESVRMYERAVLEARQEGKVVKALLLCTPHNPLGRCYSEKVLRQYMALCERLDLHLISDEIYALSVWKNPEIATSPQFISVMTIKPEGLIHPSKVCVIWGMSKDFGAPGLRIGCIVSQANRALLEAAESISLYNMPSSLADNITATLLLDDNFTDNYISRNKTRLAEHYAYVTTFLRQHGIQYQSSNAGLFVWMDLEPLMKSCQSDEAILRKLRNHKLYMTAGSGGQDGRSARFRLVFAHPKPVLKEGLRRLLDAIKDDECL